MNDDIEHATGLEKKEMLARLAGNLDPYHMNAIKRVEGATKEKPTEVPSAFEARIVGCVCKSISAMGQWQSHTQNWFAIIVYHLQATKIKHTFNGCGYIKEYQNVASAATGSNWSPLSHLTVKSSNEYNVNINNQQLPTYN